jgi:hypothetical protein
MPTTGHLWRVTTLSLLTLPAAAHHSPAMFDLTKDVTLEGTLLELSWGNPHVYLTLEVAGPGGKARQQLVEAGPASNLVTLGMREDTVRAGDRVTVAAKANRSSSTATALGWTITMSSGKTIPLHVRASVPAVPGDAVAVSIAGTWVPSGTGFTSLAVGSRDWPLTDAGRAAVAATREARIEARSECVPYGPPALMTLPSTTSIDVTDTTVTFKLDVMGVERVVHLDRPSHPAALEPTLLGHSIGRWDGDTLVVDTIGFAAHPEGFAFDLPSSAGKHAVERFTLTDDRKRMQYEAVVEDREYFSAPITPRSEWSYRPDQQPSGLPCNPEIAGRFATED